MLANLLQYVRRDVTDLPTTSSLTIKHYRLLLGHLTYLRPQSTETHYMSAKILLPLHPTYTYALRSKHLETPDRVRL